LRFTAIEFNRIDHRSTRNHPMSSEREFDDLVMFIGDVIVGSRGRGVSVDALRRTLCERYGLEHFRMEQNADLLADVVEYLLFTKRVILMAPDRTSQHF
jgi:ATP-dependent RNA circularization protein (DNA/RNA ligase family)